MITRDTAAKIWNAYREIETAENLLNELQEIKKKNGIDKNAPSLSDAFGRRKDFEFGIPMGDNGHRLFKVNPSLAESVIKAHIANKKSELAEANEQARIELSIQG